jgi:hypothetical protein
MGAAFAHQKPWWFFLALLPLIIWPFGWTWSGLAALRARRLLADPGTRLVALWTGGALVAFSLISGKQAHYLLPEIPALALMLAGGRPARMWRRRDLWLALPLFAALAAFSAAAAGLIPALRKLDDPLLLWFLVLLAGIVGFLRLPSAPVALAALPLALMVGLHLALSPLLFARYDMTALGRAVAPFDWEGIAATDGTYHAQLNFAGRLLHPVARLASPEAVATWRQAHPKGLLLDQTGLPITDMTPITALPYRGGTYTLYRSQEVAP